MNEKIVVVGSSMIDFVCYADHLPKPGETIFGNQFATNFGGKGSNQCVAAAKLGANVTMVARVGDDIWGDKYIKNFKDLGVDTKYVLKTPGFTNGIAQITVSKSGENQIIIVPGANTQLSEDDVEKTKNLIASAAILICQLETPIPTVLKALKLAKGISILNGAPGLSEYPIELVTTPSIFCVNETEAQLFTKLPVTNIDEAKRAAETLIIMGCKTVIITLGAQGSIFAENNGNPPEHVGCPKVEAVDTTGAGDAFVGALGYFLATQRGITIKEAIAGASFVAAKSVTLPGTQISYPGSSVLEEYRKTTYGTK